MIYGQENKKGQGWADSRQLNEIEKLLNGIESDGSITITRSAGKILLQAQGSAGGIAVKIKSIYPDTPSGSSDVIIYLGDVYGNGPNKTATSKDVPIKILGAVKGDIIGNGTWGIASVVTENPFLDGNRHNIYDEAGNKQTKKVYWMEYNCHGYYWCKTKSGSGLEYVVDVYGQGKDEAPTATDKYLTILRLGTGQNIPVGTWLIGLKVGSESYEGQLPIWV